MLFRTSGEFGQRPCLVYILIIGIKNKLENPDEPSHLDFHCLQMYVRIYLTLPYHPLGNTGVKHFDTLHHRSRMCCRRNRYIFEKVAENEARKK